MGMRHQSTKLIAWAPILDQHSIAGHPVDVEAGSSDVHLEGFEEQYVVVPMYVEIEGKSYRLQQCNHNVCGRMQHGSCAC